MFRRYLVPFKAHRLPHVLTDALVIGGGVGGLRAALAAAGSSGSGNRPGDCEVLLLTKTEVDKGVDETNYADWLAERGETA